MTIHHRATLAVLLALTAPAAAVPEKPVNREVAGEDDQLYACKKGQGQVAVTFKPETELKDLITWAMSFTCKSFMLDPRITLTGKKVTLIVPTKLAPPEAYRVFLAALSTAGVTVVPKGPVLRIVDAGIARHDTVPIYKKGLPDDLDQVVRYVYRPTYAQVETLKTAFTAVKTDTGEITTVGSLLVIADFATNVRDMLSLAKLIDVPGGSDGIYTIPIRHADATKLAPKLESFLGVSASGASPAPTAAKMLGAAPPAPTEIASAVPSKIMVDDRTNTLVVAASEAAYQRVRAIVERLDIALEIEGGATFHVYPLAHAVAEELANTLNQAISSSPTPQQKPAAGQPKPVPTPTPAPAGPEAAPALEGPVRVIGEKATNSVIVMSSGRDFLAIRDIIRQLDQPRRQVYIEAMILEIGVDSGLTLGASGHGGITRNGSAIVAGTQLGGSSTLSTDSLKSSAALSTGLVGALVGPMLKNIGLGTTIPSYAVLFQAVSNRSTSNILSAPSLIAVDNEEAKYAVGTKVPIPKGTIVTPTGTVSQNVEPTDVLLELAVKAHISPDDTILLELKHGASDVVGKNEFGPILSKRDFETRVVVRDQQTVVIGGLMQERTDNETSKVPLLGDVPLLGRLFSYTKQGKRKTNLLVMLTPYIIKDQLELQTLRERKLREHDEFVGSVESLRAARFMPAMDYSRKRGVLEEINRVVQEVELETAARKALHETPTVQPGAIEYTPKAD